VTFPLGTVGPLFTAQLRRRSSSSHTDLERLCTGPWQMNVELKEALKFSYKLELYRLYSSVAISASFVMSLFASF